MIPFKNCASHPHPVNTPLARTFACTIPRGFAPLSHRSYRTHMCDRTFARTHTNILVVTHNSKSDLPLAILLEHMHKKFEINQTKIKVGCQSERKVVPHDSKSDLPLMSSKPSETSEASESPGSSVSSNLSKISQTCNQRKYRTRHQT